MESSPKAKGTVRLIPVCAHKAMAIKALPMERKKLADMATCGDPSPLR
jgi:hypothetical protein